MKIAEKLKMLSFSQLTLYASLFCIGVFHEYLSCILSAVLLARLLMCLIKQRSLTVRITMTGIAVALLVSGYAVTSLWAVDSGAAIFGFFKFLPLLLYLLVLMQEPDGREKTLNGLPYVASVMTVLSVALMYVPGLETYFAVSGRLSGFVQYPNTFALILLVAELLLIMRERPHIQDYVCILILLFGIVYTGSRTVLVLAGVSNVAALLFNKNKKVRWITLGGMVLGVLLVFLVCLATDNLAVLARYLKISLNQSTFIGRLLYAQDALPVILKHPFGLGYMGYYYLQQSVQTGLYAVKFIHNDLLQMLLDVGWIPTAVFVVAAVMSLLNRAALVRDKLIMTVILLHACFDFDLQYIAVFMLLLLFMTPRELKIVTLSKHRAFTSTLASILIGLCAYAGVVQGLIRFEAYGIAYMMYPASTQCEIEILKKLEDPAQMNRVADSILKRNPYVSVAYSAKAKYAYSRGDFAGVITYKNKAIKAAPFTRAEYVEYGYMLINGIHLYENAGDTNSAAICKRELETLKEALPAMKNRLSKFGAAIETQPVFTFPKELREYFEKLEREE